MRTAWLVPWTRLSSTAVTVTVWAVSQLVGVKVSDAGLTVAPDGLVLLETGPMTTLDAGSVFSTIV